MGEQATEWPPERAVPRPHPAVLFEELDGEGVVYDERSAAMHRLDPIATVVWRCLDGQGTVGELAVELAEAFGAPPEQVGADLAAHLTWLADHGLLEGSAAPVAADGETGPQVFRPRPHG